VSLACRRRRSDAEHLAERTHAPTERVERRRGVAGGLVRGSARRQMGPGGAFEGAHPHVTQPPPAPLDPRPGLAWQQRPRRDQPGHERRTECVVEPSSSRERLRLVARRHRGVEVDPASLRQCAPVEAGGANDERAV
jgi:hypothetical protein